MLYQMWRKYSMIDSLGCALFWYFVVPPHLFVDLFNVELVY